jgi:tRNA A37 threonylcarbamoyladenosine biosynthesis protein TsaE
MNDGQKTFKATTDNFMSNASQKMLIVRSRYGSGKTTFLQRLIKERDLKSVLFITYRQTWRGTS